MGKINDKDTITQQSMQPTLAFKTCLGFPICSSFGRQIWCPLRLLNVMERLDMTGKLVGLFSASFVALRLVGCWATPECLSKKHLDVGQGLEFLKFGQGNRGLNQHRRRTKETIRNHEGKRWNIDKTIRGRDTYFLFFLLFNLFGVQSWCWQRAGPGPGYVP